MGDLLTIPTSMATGAYTQESSVELKSLNRITNTQTAVTVSPNPDLGEYQTIQSAINALSDEGGVVLVKKGTYTLSSAISIPDKNITIEGENADEVIIDGNNGSYHAFSVSSFSKKLVIKNLTVKNVSQSSSYSTVYLYNSTKQGTAWISGCNLSDCEYGIYVHRFSKVVIVDCDISDCGGTGIYSTTSTTDLLKILSCDISDCDDYGLYLRSLGTMEISDNTIGEMEYCVKLTIDDLTFTNNVLTMAPDYTSAARIGFDLVGSSSLSKALVQGNTIKLTDTISVGKYTYSVYVNGGSGLKLTFVDNTVLFTLKINSSSGFCWNIYLKDISNCNISRNNMIVDNIGTSTNKCHGIKLDNANYCVVSSNRSEFPGLAGNCCVSYTGSDYNSIQGNMVKNGIGATGGSGCGACTIVDNVSV